MTEIKVDQAPGVVENSTEKDETTKNEQKTKGEEAKTESYKSLSISNYGGSKQIRLESTEIRKPGMNEIELTVEACGVNFLDIMVRQGLLDQPYKPPFVLGSECAGIVTAIGPEVTKYKVGDRLVALLKIGAWTERLTLPVDERIDDQAPVRSTNVGDVVLLPWPGKLTTSQSAVFSFAYLPAYILIHHVAHLQAGNVVLVHSAGGGVGSAIGQLCKLIPNIVLIGTASKHKHEKLTGLYDNIFTPEEDWTTAIQKNYPQGIDVILDCLSGEEIGKSYDLLKPLGKYIVYGTSNLVSGDRRNFLNLAKHWYHTERISPLRLYEENRIIGGFCLKSLLFPRVGQTNKVASSSDFIHSVWTKLIKLLEQKSIDPWIDSEWSFDEVKQAMARLQNRKNIGKVVLLPKMVKPSTEAGSLEDDQPKVSGELETNKD